MKNLNRHLLKTENDQTQKLGGKKMKAKKLILGLVALSILSFAVSVSAGVPQMINYQGVLTDPDGCPEDGDYSIGFSIWNYPSNGDSLWGEAHSPVSVTQGNFNVLLGSSNPIPDYLFLNDSLWLQIEVNGEVMEPRQRIASVGYALHSQFADTADHCWTISDGDWIIDGDNIYRLEGNVGIGTEDPDFDTKLDVWTPGGTAVKGESEDESGGKFGGEFYANGAGYSNVGVWARAGCYGLGCSPASVCNIGIYAKDGSDGTQDVLPSGDWAGYFKGDVKITDSLDVGGNATIDDDLSVGGTLKLTFDYNSGWFSISEGGTVTLTHGLGGDESKYIVDLYGKSLDGKIHQAAHGITCYGWPSKCAGCEWYGLTNSQIKVHRAPDDDDEAPNKDWDKCRVRILKNQ